MRTACKSTGKGIQREGLREGGRSEEKVKVKVE
jgi:hypothetical protein